jgi:hypothetical protein
MCYISTKNALSLSANGLGWMAGKKDHPQKPYLK